MLQVFQLFYKLQVFYQDVAKVDLGIAHIAVGLICSTDLLQLLGPPACTWVWRGRHGAGAGHGVGAGHEAMWAPT
jgi:hypothetical protein